MSMALPQIVDVHSHIVPSNLPGDPTNGGIKAWPCMTCSADKGLLLIGGTPYREFDDRNWSVTRRLDHMDSHGIGLQALSPLPELLSYWVEAGPAAMLCAHVNDQIADMVSAQKSRFVGLGMVPLQNVDLAIKEAVRVKRDLGFPGIEIGSNIDGVSPADPRFEAFYEAVAELGLSVFVHGMKPAAPERYIGPDVMPAILGVPMDTAIAIGSFIASDIQVRHPNLRLCFSHAGGAIGAVIDRFQHVWNIMPIVQDSIAIAPVDAIKSFFFDIMTFSDGYSTHLIEKFGVDSFVVGTDFPAGGMGLMDPAAFLQSLNISAAARGQIARENGLRFLGL
jgi:aminocarboxymuconate-semialdehyde decarboxylase